MKTPRPLTKPEESILALGLKFVPVPTSIPEKTVIAETEAVARSLEEEDATKLRSAVQSCLNNSMQATQAHFDQVSNAGSPAA